MATIFFTSSDFFIEEFNASECALIEVTDYVGATYNQLRSAPNGEIIASLDTLTGAWVLNDGRRFSDWVVSVLMPDDLYIIEIETQGGGYRQCAICYRDDWHTPGDIDHHENCTDEFRAEIAQKVNAV